MRQFRNFAELELSFPPEGIALIGDNGSGKTNLLESIYYLEIFRSFRGAPDEQLVRLGEEAFFVRGRFGTSIGAGPDEVREVTAAYQRRGRRKRITVDAAEPERLGDALGRVGAVVFSPADVSIVAGAPGGRRRFLDIVLSLNSPGYLRSLQRYRQILRQRNAMLREGAARELFTGWDETLIEAGARIIAERAAWVLRRNEGFSARVERIGGSPARLRYVPAVALPASETAEFGAAAIAEAFRDELTRTAKRERERRITLAGPHRDRLGFEVETGGGELDLRDFGSSGQQRTAAIALRMIEADTIRGARGGEPLVLLDDIFAELDHARAARILELLESDGNGQVILTAPKSSDLEPRRGRLARWRIANGRVEQ